MKRIIGAGSFLIILASLLTQYSLDLNTEGKLTSPFLRNHLIPLVEPLTGLATNFKFKLRGVTQPQSKTVIIAVDNASVDQLGRFPWHRDTFAAIIQAALQLGTKAVGLDITFSEPEDRIPKEVYEELKQDNKNSTLIEQLKKYEGDPILAEVIQTHANKIALGYATLSEYNTLYFSKDDLLHQLKYDVGDQFQQAYQQSLERTLPAIKPFAFQQLKGSGPDHFVRSPLPLFLDGVFNIPEFSNVALHAGFFTATLDQDGYVRRYKLAMQHQGYIVPSLALAMYQISLPADQKLGLKLDPQNNIQALMLNNEDLPLAINPDSSLHLNFRGPQALLQHGSDYARTSEENLSFPYVSAADVLTAFLSPHENPKLTEKIKQQLDQSYAFLGVTALGLHDMRSFPFGANTPGIEGHAAAFDNLLHQDSLKTFGTLGLNLLPLILMASLGVLFTFAFLNLGAVPSIIIFLFFTLIGGASDYYAFVHGYNFNTVFILIEILLIFLLNLSLKYIMEEQNKKFIRDAFSRYLAPQVVDYVLKNPEKLSVGGDRKELSIVFTDLRGFTTLSETLDPKTLSQFLNEYLTAMTNIIFEQGGTLDKYIGDAVMAFWGAPLDVPLHAYQACKSAVSMQKKIHELQPHFKNKYNLYATMGVGINSGLVSVGNMGSEKIFEYTVIGDHVNLASRLEGLTKYYGADILCSKFTLDAIPEQHKSEFHYRVLDSVKVKGKHQAIDLVELSIEPYQDQFLEYYYLAKEEYKKKNWDLSIQYFQKAQEHYQKQKNKDDEVCKLFILRAQDFKTNPPNEHWDGSHEMKEK